MPNTMGYSSRTVLALCGVRCDVKLATHLDGGRRILEEGKQARRPRSEIASKAVGLDKRGDGGEFNDVLCFPHGQLLTPMVVRI